MENIKREEEIKEFRKEKQNNMYARYVKLPMININNLEDI